MRDVQSIKSKCLALASRQHETTLRLWVAVEAQAEGRGGVSRVGQAIGMSRATIYAGLKGLASIDRSPDGTVKSQHKSAGLGRTRASGGGRKKLIDKDPILLRDLGALVEPAVRGDPQSPLRWTCKNTPRLAAGLKQLGHKVSQSSLCDLLAQLGYSLQSAGKTREGRQCLARAAQFRHIAEQGRACQVAGKPLILVDTKKKLIGNFKNCSREWRPKDSPASVRVHDFVDPALGKVAVYGVDDVAANQCFVNVGTDHDTAEFAVESIRLWWQQVGRPSYPSKRRPLTNVGCGGSNGYQVRLWRLELQELADEMNFMIKVCLRRPSSGTRSSIGCSAASPITGATDLWSVAK